MTFPRARKGRPGYDIDEVEDFLEDARRAYTAENPDTTVITADSIRTTAFSLRKGGDSTSPAQPRRRRPRAPRGRVRRA